MKEIVAWESPAGDGITYPTCTNSKTNSRVMQNYALV